MKTLLDVAVDVYGHLIAEGKRSFLVAAHAQLELGKAEFESEITGCKTARELTANAGSLQLLLLVEAAPEDVLSEDADSACLSKARVKAWIDGFKLVRQYGEQIDLSGANLRGAQLQRAVLNGANLQDTDLQGADLERASMKEVNFTGANLQGANFTRANLFGSRFDSADLRRANLKFTELRQSSWKSVAMRGAELWDANIWGVDLSEAFTEGVDLSRADTRGNQ